MRNLKGTVLLATLALGGAAFAAAPSGATLTVNNVAADTITAGQATLTWRKGDLSAVGTGSLSWTTPADYGTAQAQDGASVTRKISAQLGAALPGWITSLKAVSGGVTGSGTPAAEQSLSASAGAILINDIDAYSSGSSSITYTAAIDSSHLTGFNSGTEIVVNYTISSDQ